MKIQIKKYSPTGIRLCGMWESTQILTVRGEGIELCYNINRGVGLTLDKGGGNKIEVEI